jgi:prolipoprotein diacylglyceryl transferase
LWWVFIGLIGIAAIVLGVTNNTVWAIVVGVILIVLVVLWFIPRTRGLLQRLAGSSSSTFPDEGLPLGPWLDIAAVALPLGQAIGRWANWVNQELYGTVTSLPWGITIDSSHRVAPYGSTVDFPVGTTLFHPLFLYESLWSILAFFVLLNIFLRNRHRLLPGDIFLFYIMQYSVIRFLLEFLRVEVSYLPGTSVNLSQVVCVFAFVASLLYFLYRHRPGAVHVAPPEPQPIDQQPAEKMAQ